MSNFTDRYPEYAAVEEHIRRAHLERSVAVAHMFATAIEASIRGVKRLADSMGNSLQAEHERRLIQADSFLRRSVPHR